MKPEDKGKSLSKVDKALDNNPIKGFQLPYPIQQLKFNLNI